MRGQGSSWMLLLLLVGMSMLASHSVDAETVVVLRASGSADSSPYMQKVVQAVQERTNEPASMLLRTVTVAQVKTDVTTTGPQVVEFGTSSAPLTASEAASFPGGVMHLPFAWSTVSVYASIQGTITGNVNMTACLVARIFNGQVAAWSAPEIKDANPNLATALKDAPISVFILPATDPATIALTAWLAAACPSVPLAFPAALRASSDIGSDVTKNAYAIGYMQTSKGISAGLAEVAIQNKNGVYLQSAKANDTDTLAAITALLPASFTSSFASVSAINMAGATVFPIVAVHYMYVPVNVSAWATDQGPLLQAVGKFVMSSDGQALLTGTGLKPMVVGSPSTVATAATTALGTMTLGAAPFTLEAAGASGSVGTSKTSISGNRVGYTSSKIAELESTIASMKATIARNSMKVLRGSGSSAVQLVMWRLMDQFSSMSSTPVWLTYRAIGSGGGESEIVGANNNYKPWVDFAASDVPMATASWKALRTAGAKVLQIPIGLSPISFFANLPAKVVTAAGGRLKLSPCTVAKIFSGEAKTWDDAAIAADMGFTLPAEAITFLYRTASSGSTAVVTEYLTRACPGGWTFGSGKTIAQWTSIPNAIGALNTLDLGNKILNYTYSIGYLEAGIGQSLRGAIEISLKNKAGAFLTSAESDVGASALQLFSSGGWPADPTDDFSAVSLLDQPGDKTWPISSMPLMFVRVDNVAGGDVGPLLAAFIAFLLQSTTQAQLTQLGFSPMPDDVLAYTLTRAVPLMLTDPKQKQWFFEAKATPYKGSGDNVFTDQALKSTYSLYSILQIQADALAAKKAAENSTANGLAGLNVTQLLANVSGLNGTTPAAISSSLDQMDERITKLQSVAIAGVAFGVAGSILALFAMCRVFIISAIAPYNPKLGGASDAGGASLAGGGSQVRRKSNNGFGGDLSVRQGSNAQLGLDVAVPPVSKDKGMGMV